MNTRTIICARKPVHGEYSNVVAKAQAIKRAILMGGGGCGPLTDLHLESIEMIATKLARICCGDPNFRDHWDDIAGYATLVSDRLPKETT